MSDTPNLPTPTLQDLKNTLKLWNSNFIEDHLDAEETLKSWGSKAPELLLELLQAEAIWQKKKRACFWVLLISALCFAFFVTIYILFVLNRPELLGLLGMMGSLGGLAGLYSPSRNYLNAVQILSQTEDVRFVGYLAEALSFPLDAKTKITISRTLLRLLPEVSLEAAEYLTPQHRNALRKILRSRQPLRETRLILETMSALERIEDVGAIPEIKRISQNRGSTQRDGALRERASTALIALGQAQSRQEAGSQLLRAAMPTTPTNELLRPAKSTTKTEEAHLLLRASQSHEES